LSDWTVAVVINALVTLMVCCNYHTSIAKNKLNHKLRFFSVFYNRTAMVSFVSYLGRAEVLSTVLFTALALCADATVEM